MKNEKLAEIIQRKNERLEDEAVQTAESLINDILTLQQAVSDANAEIKNKQDDLRKLEIQSVDASSILGSGGQ